MADIGIKEHLVTGPDRDSVAYYPKGAVVRMIGKLRKSIAEKDKRIAELEKQNAEYVEEIGLLQRRKYALECRIDADEAERREHGEER